MLIMQTDYTKYTKLYVECLWEEVMTVTERDRERSEIYGKNVD